MHTASKPTRVLVVDDSALMRKLLTELLDQDPRMQVVGTASDPYAAREKIKALNPDVLTLDVEMPRMDGLTFLSNLMRLRPMPVVMVSALTERGADVTLRALELGAVDFVTKPRIDLARGVVGQGEAIVEKVWGAARARLSGPKIQSEKQLRGWHPGLKTTDRLIAIGASTGGVEAIRHVLSALPPDGPGVVITQHIPETFSASFARRLNECTSLRVAEASDGDTVSTGHVYIAPGNRHLKIVRSGARYVCRLDDGPAVSRHKPSVDVLFNSVAQAAGVNAVGVILTGMGQDGANGLKAMSTAGAHTVAQDEASSVVWGMPGRAVQVGAVKKVLPLGRIAAHICEHEGQ
ncbi:MAG: chemotaxis response regulator protein-glutamate methylesterase [Bradymonadia bacterium]